MKKTLPFLCALICALPLSAQVPTCVRDSSIIATGALLAPAPYTDDKPDFNLADACIGQFYTQSVTVNVPTTFQGIPITTVSLATTGAVSNLPVGITYACDPPSCVFAAGSLGCIVLYGTPTSANVAPDTLDLGITATVNTPFGGLPVEFPGQLAPGSHYYLRLYETGQCMSGTFDAGGQIAKLGNAPNPFNGQTTIVAESLVAGTFQFEVFNLLGQKVHSRNLRLENGRNEFNFDAGQLQKGVYIYTLSNREGRAVRQMIID
jgi:hypothetical protein